MKLIIKTPSNWDCSKDMERSNAALRDPKLKYMAAGLAHGPGTRKKKKRKK